MDCVPLVKHSLDPRSDMRFFNQGDVEAGSMSSSISFESFSGDHADSYFRIPRAILISRMFARDRFEALYVDHMQRFIGRVDTTNERVYILKIPLVSLGDSLGPKLVNIFLDREYYGTNIDDVLSWCDVSLRLLRYSVLVIICRDVALHVPSTSEVVVCDGVSGWSTCTSPPIEYYYHERIRKALFIELGERLFFATYELRIPILYGETWRLEVFRVFRGFFLPIHTIGWLRDRRLDVPFDIDSNVVGNGPIPIQ